MVGEMKLDEGVKARATNLYAGKLFPSDVMETAQHTQALFPTRKISKGARVKANEDNDVSIADLTFMSGGNEYDLYDYMAHNHVYGLHVAQDGKKLYDRYEFNVTPDTLWMSMSMAKSVSTTLVGVAVRDGFIQSLNDPLAKYLPAVTGSAYEKVTVRQLITMTSGVDWDDTHTDENSDRRHMLSLQLNGQSGAIFDYLCERPQRAAPGTRWNYSTGETHLVGELVRAASGKWLSDYLSEKIWAPMGAQSDAMWWLEAPGGLEVAGAGICATLPDYVRFGSFMLNDGVIDGLRVLPDGWSAEAASPTVASEGSRHYGYMWWPVKDPDGSYTSGAYSARGIFGQYIYINPKKRLVIGVVSARPKPRFSEVIQDDDFFNAVAARV
ncbi:MAG: serine hydrolase [Pseudomonadota bacterium]